MKNKMKELKDDVIATRASRDLAYSAYNMACTASYNLSTDSTSEVDRAAYTESWKVKDAAWEAYDTALKLSRKAANRFSRYSLTNNIL